MWFCRPTPRLATRPESRPEPLNYVVPREEPIVQSAVSPDNNNSCGCDRGKCSSVLKCLAIFPILAIIFGITLVPCYILAKEVIIQDKATFDEIVQKYKFEVFVVSFCFFRVEQNKLRMSSEASHIFFFFLLFRLGFR